MAAGLLKEVFSSFTAKWSRECMAAPIWQPGLYPFILREKEREREVGNGWKDTERQEEREVMDAETNDTQKTFGGMKKALHTHSQPPLHYCTLKGQKNKINTPVLSVSPCVCRSTLADNHKQGIKHNAGQTESKVGPVMKYLPLPVPKRPVHTVGASSTPCNPSPPVLPKTEGQFQSPCSRLRLFLVLSHLWTKQQLD